MYQYWWGYAAGILILVMLFIALAVAAGMLVSSHTVSGVLFVAVGSFIQLGVAIAQAVIAILMAVEPVPILEDYSLVTALCASALVGLVASAGVWNALLYKTRYSVLSCLSVQLLTVVLHAGALYLIDEFIAGASEQVDSTPLTQVLEWSPQLGIDTRSTAYVSAASAVALFSTDSVSAQKSTVPLRAAVTLAATEAASGLLWLQLVAVAVAFASAAAARLFLRSMDTVALLLTPEGILHARELAKKADVVELMFARNRAARSDAAAALKQRAAKRQKRKRRRKKGK